MRRIAKNFALLLSMGGLCASKTWAQQNSAVPLRLEKSLSYVQCSIGDSGPLNCLLDTGSAMTGISQKIADRLRLKTHRDDTILRPDLANKVLDTLALHVGNLTWSARRTSIAPADLDLLDKEVGPQFHTDVVIGTELLEHYQITIDPDVMEVRFASPGSIVSPPAAKLVTAIFGVPFALLSLKSAEGHAILAMFSLDTGSRPALMLSRPFWSKQPPIATLGESDPQNGSFTLSAIRIAHTTMTKVLAFEPQAGSGLLASKTLGGVIGGPLLNHFIVTYDLPNNSVWMTPSQRNPPQ